MSHDDLDAAARAARHLASGVAGIRGLAAAGVNEGVVKRLADELNAEYQELRKAIRAVEGEVRLTRQSCVRFGSLAAPTAHEAAVRMLWALNKELFGVEDIGRGQMHEWPDADEVIAEIELELTKARDNREQGTDSPNDYADYRNGPNGPLLTPKYCKERFNVSGKDLSTNPEAKRTRLKNPGGRTGGDYVYRYDVVSRIANRKSGDEE